MAFSKNPEVLEARIADGLFDDLIAGRACRWTTTQDPAATRRLADKIRESLHIASLHPDRFPELAQAYQNFTIFLVQPGLVEARVKLTPTVAVAPAAHHVPEHGQQPWGTPNIPQVSLETAQDLIDAWMRHLPSNDPMNFPQVTLSIDEKLKLHAWVQKQVPKMMMLVGHSMITLSLLEAGMEEVAWHPPKAAPKPEPEYDL